MDHNAASSLRPFAWIAAAAFVVGLLGYLVVGRPLTVAAGPVSEPAPVSAAASGPASEDWNLPKHI